MIGINLRHLARKQLGGTLPQVDYRMPSFFRRTNIITTVPITPTILGQNSRLFLTSRDPQVRHLSASDAIEAPQTEHLMSFGITEELYHPRAWENTKRATKPGYHGTTIPQNQSEGRSSMGGLATKHPDFGRVELVDVPSRPRRVPRVSGTVTRSLFMSRAIASRSVGASK
jgi:hypothetical protein